MARFKKKKPLSKRDEARREQAIFALVHERSTAAASRASGIPRRTLFRWLADPEFMAKFRQARRGLFDDALFVLEKNAPKAAWRLVDEIDDDTASSLERSPLYIRAATAILDLAFKAQSTIAVEEELATLRALIEEMKTVAALPLQPPDPSTEAIRKAKDEATEAARLHVV